MSGDAFMTAIYGRRGTGKSTLARELASSRERVVVFDPIGEWAEHGYRAVTWHELASVLVRRRFKVSYVPQRGASAEALHMIARGLASAFTRIRQVTLVVEEMSLSFPVYSLPVQLFGFKDACERGRHYGINVIGTTQRPASVSTTFRGNVDESYTFALDWATDRDAILAMIGRQHAKQLAGLVPGQYLHYRHGVLKPGGRKFSAHR